MVPVGKKEREDFLQMAEQHFRSLNPSFIPQADWVNSYFETIQNNSNYFLRWIVADGQRSGFILFGLEKHRFLPRTAGHVYELYVCPAQRRRGIALQCARQVIGELQKMGPSKIELEVMEGNEGAKALWHSLGFQKVSERFVLPQIKA